MSTTELTRLQAMHGLESRTVTQQQVALQLGLSVRQVKRLWRRFRLEAEAGLISRRRGKPSNRRTDPVLMERALELVRTLYPDFGPTLAAEKLDELHGIRIDHETLRRALVACGLRKLKRRKRLRVHPSRDRRPCRGELAQIDGSHHPWFENRAPGCTLYVDVDDATSQLLALHFGVGETTAGYFELARQHILNHGVPLAFYADKYSVFRINNVGDAAELRTQFGRAMDDLDVELICAHSPQAKGRVERANSTLQDRLVKELRLRNISTIDRANDYLPAFIEQYNRRFAVPPESQHEAHRPKPTDALLDRMLCVWHERSISKNLTVRFDNQIFEILVPDQTRRLRHAKVMIYIDRAGVPVIEREGRVLPWRKVGARAAVPEKDAKELAEAGRIEGKPHPYNPPPMSHPWKAASFQRRLARGGRI